MRKSFGRRRLKVAGGRTNRSPFRCGLERMESRELLTATPTGLPTFSSAAENSATFGANSYMAVLESNHGTGSYGFPQWGFLEFGDSSAVFDSNSVGTSDSTAPASSSITRRPAGTFGPMPAALASMSFPTTPSAEVPAGTVRDRSGQVGTMPWARRAAARAHWALRARPAIGGRYLEHRWTLPGGYSTFTGSTSGSTSAGTGTFGSASVLGSSARSTIAADLNNHTPLRFAVVADDTGFAADWEGNFSSNQPTLALDINETPDVYFSATTFASEATAGGGITIRQLGTYTVNEVDQIPANSTTATINVDRTSDPSATTTIHWAVTGGTAPLTGATSGDITFNPGDISKPININFSDITTTDPSRSVTVTLTDPGQTGGDPARFPDRRQHGHRADQLPASRQHLDRSASYAVNEADGHVRVYVDRTGGNVATTSADVTLSTANGLAYQTSFQDPQDAEAGRDFGTSGKTLPPSYAVHFNVGQSQAYVDIPLLNLATFAGTRTFSASLSSPSTGTRSSLRRKRRSRSPTTPWPTATRPRASRRTLRASKPVVRTILTASLPWSRRRRDRWAFRTCR